ncbi:MAG TPA: helix-hairpin-helix domain-containing protein, partial [Telluria sp.]
MSSLSTPGAGKAGSPALVHNADVAEVMREIADLLEIKGENIFRIRAYRNLARTLDNLGPSVQGMLAEHRNLDDLPGVGPDLAGKIAEIVATGTCTLREQLHHELPPGLDGLLRIPGLGPRRVMALYRGLGIHTVDELAAAARDGALARLPGFGEKTAQRILDTLAARRVRKPRMPRARAAAVAQALLAWLAAPGDLVAEAAGSLRRGQETVGDIDIVGCSPHPAAVLERFSAYPDVASVLVHGPTRAGVLLRQGVQVDLRVVPVASFGAALHYFTGSKNHNIALRRLAQSQGFKLNEYGLFSGSERVAGTTEHEVFARLGLDDIPPELRENRGEIEAAAAHRLPRLVERADLRGDLHVHTTASDGRDKLATMVDAAREAGLDYIAITDHSPGLRVAHGLDADALLRQGEEIARLNETLAGFRILHGCEVDILSDGGLDLPDDVLRRLDLVIGAVHAGFGLAREHQTTRILRALERPVFHLLAHPRGRLLSGRAGIEVDMERVLRQAHARGCALEVNAQPDRLDLD